ncbi:hypothetical protein BDV96DRAFT_648015 [Lophiotrema nucula]|uniref:Uncharacterized protein n=1 Tax=Lophiotrema nucula TaxID=690887 RepID=A0A6A5Z623_9PLEO|nr:hypothetical protein BDV96DRAFT_648015 [Lophiotrema nucula]
MPLESTYLSSCYEYIFGGPPRPKFKPFRPNRVDALPSLIQWHEDITESKSDPPFQTSSLSTLPIRSRVRSLFTDSERWMSLHMDQTHAYYEEIDSIPAAAVGTKSPFEDKHWHVVHPLQPHHIRALSTRVLQDLRKWIQNTIHIYIGEHKQIGAFVKVRIETMEAVLKELAYRGADNVEDDEGYLGTWEECTNAGIQIEDDEDVEIIPEMASGSETVAMNEEDDIDVLDLIDRKLDGGEQIERLTGGLKGVDLDDGILKEVHLN